MGNYEKRGSKVSDENVKCWIVLKGATVITPSWKD